MRSFNKVIVIIRAIIDGLFNSNGFECRKLFYYGRHELKCLNYNENFFRCFKSFVQIKGINTNI